MILFGSLEAAGGEKERRKFRGGQKERREIDCATALTKWRFTPPNKQDHK